MSRVQEQFDRLFQGQGAHLPADIDRASFVESHIPGLVRTILDVGCGSGLVARRLKREFQVCGAEFSFTGARKTAAGGVTCVQASIDSLPFTDSSFDLVMANEVLEHLSDDLLGVGLREISRVAGQYILITVPNRDNLAFLRQECPRCRTISVPWGHLRPYAAETMPAIEGFNRIETAVFGPRLPDGYSLLTRFLYWPRLVRHPLQPGMTCPVCGYTADASVRCGLFGLLRRVVEGVGRRLSPKCPRWIFALYCRQEQR